MAALDFPNTPTVGQTFASAGTTWIWDGAKWEGVGPGASPGWTTGDVKLTFKAVADTGWVLMNDGTIGDASSGATTRANADCVNLFMLFWNNVPDAWCPVGGGRGASAAADWSAHKTIKLPRQLGRALAVAGAGTGLTSRTLGAFLGEEAHAQTGAELAVHAHVVSDPGHNHTLNDPTHAHSVYDPSHTHGISGGAQGQVYGAMGGGGFFSQYSANIAADPLTIDYAGTGIGIYGASTGCYNSASATGITIQNAGAASAANVMQPTSFLNVMVCL
jgi:microcystin-dependent protein